MTGPAAQLSYVTTCKGRLAHLKQSLARVASQPGIECIVVDYDCPDGAAAWVEKEFPSARVVRVTGREGFNASHARNVGAQNASAPWLGFFDADVLVAPDFFRRVLPELVPGSYYRPHPVTFQTWGSLICHRDDFRRTGGYDEAYVGWGGEDDDLIAMLRLNEVKPMGFPASLVDEIPHGDEERTRYSQVKNRWTQSRINQLYLQVKLDLIRMNGRGLDKAESAAVFSEIQKAAVAAESAGTSSYYVDVTLPATVARSFPRDHRVEVFEVQKAIRYTVRIVGLSPGP